MKNLYKYNLNIKTGSLIKIVIKDVTVVNREKIVTKRERTYDLKYGNYVNVSDLNKYITSPQNDVIAYFSMNDDIDIDKIKDMAWEILVRERAALEKQIADKQQMINKILKAVIDEV